MDTEKRSINSIFPNENNVRKHPEFQIKEMWKSVVRYGQIRPIVIDENGVILAGHGLYQACLANGKEEVDVIVMKGLSEKDKKKLLLVDNKIYSLGTDNYAAVESILAEIGSENDFDIPGYDPSILEEMYGVKSIEKEVEREAPFRAPDAPESPLKAVDSYEPSSRVTEARQEAVKEAEKFVICPSCGEKIYL